MRKKNAKKDFLGCSEQPLCQKILITTAIYLIKALDILFTLFVFFIFVGTIHEMARYSKLYGIPCTGLRFFTVYGPAGRPDMAYFGFTNKLIKGEKIQIYNYGNCLRDFTYVDDIVEGVQRVMYKPPEQKKGVDGLPEPAYTIYNIGSPGH